MQLDSYTSEHFSFSMDYDLVKHCLQSRGLDFWHTRPGKQVMIEPKILPLVAVLNYFGYPTEQSCEGHSFAERKQKLLERQQKSPNQRITITREDAYTLEYEVDKSQLPP